MKHHYLLDELVDNCRPLSSQGKTATYIPELAKVDPGLLGITMIRSGGDAYYAGDANVPFTIQSIAKVFIFTCAIMDSGLDKILSKVSLEPSASNFNSISDLESKNGSKPLNPMINAGAIACLTFVSGKSERDKFLRVLDFARTLASNSEINIDEAVYLSEKQTGSRNRALAYYMESTNVIGGDVEELLDAYFRICAIKMTCVDLARCALVYAGNGYNQYSGEQCFSPEVGHSVKAVMATCGMYNESGSFAVDIGLPSKSGVGGGILSIVPGQMGIGVFGPALNEKGSSVAGLEMLRQLSRRLDLSIY